LLEKAHHANQLVELEPGPDMDHIFEAFICGEIELDERRSA